MKTPYLKIEHRYPEDIERIINVVNTQTEHYISPIEADLVWTAYSESMAAGWLTLPEDDEYLIEYLERGKAFMN